jgi:hypothetical protein
VRPSFLVGVRCHVLFRFRDELLANGYEHTLSGILVSVINFFIGAGVLNVILGKENVAVVSFPKLSPNGNTYHVV